MKHQDSMLTRTHSQEEKRIEQWSHAVYANLPPPYAQKTRLNSARVPISPKVNAHACIYT